MPLQLDPYHVVQSQNKPLLHAQNSCTFHLSYPECSTVCLFGIHIWLKTSLRLKLFNVESPNISYPIILKTTNLV